ncbi:hypothetical protein MMC17_006885 [Xylographa soralifera]|nr:hypothetical protein [Xylographa soralifera]MCJ1383771.1 hypothetical protein [Xylographa soralifera]
MPSSPEDPKLLAALSAIDAAHALDPNIINTLSGPTPYELHYARKMTSYLTLRCPSAPATLQLAIRAQHFRRWEIPRDSYPLTKPGYFAWRTFLKKRQAEQAAQICRESGLSDTEAERVAMLIRKEDLKGDEETQVLEDVASLVFLDDQFEEFERRLGDEEKMVGILRRTWAKMSEPGREMALQMEMGENAKRLVGRALAG